MTFSSFPHLIKTAALLPALLCGLASAQSTQPADLTTFDLSGSVHNLEETVSTVEDGKTMLLPYTDTYRFNAQGQLVERTTVDTEADAVSERTLHRYEAGQLVETRTYAGGTPTVRVDFSYDEGQWLESTIYGPDGSPYGVLSHDTQARSQPDLPLISRTFDSSGRVITEATFAPGSGTPDTVKRWVYEGDLLVETRTETAAGDLLDRQTYRHNEAGQVEEHSMYAPDGVLLERITYAYNDKGDVIAADTTDAQGMSLSHLFYIYSYDAQDNWLTKATYWRPTLDEAPVYEGLTSRTLTYYGEAP